MKKYVLTLLFILIGTTVISAQCTQAEIDNYIKNAATYIEYPNYFGAAGEYAHAAECYAELGNSQLSEQYYVKAAEHYITASDHLINYGDYYQKAKSIELAGSSYEKSGDIERAINYYTQAKDIYLKNNYLDQSNALSGKITEIMGSPYSDEIKETRDIISYIGVMSLIALILSLYGLIKVYPAYADYMRNKPRYESPRSMQVRREEPTHVHHVQAEPKPRQYTQEFTEKTLSPKEKMAKKLREKYMLK